MGMCSFKCLLQMLFKFALVFLLVVFLPGLPPEGTFTATKVAPVRKLEGPLALNTKLNNAEHIFKDKVRGAECFAEWGGELYTAIHGGEVVKLSKGGHVTHVVKFGHPCEGYWQEKRCGRPLGMAFDSKGALHVMDAYYGVWKVDVSTGKKQLLVSPDVEIEGRKPKLFNSIAMASNGDFFWTDSSSNIVLEDGVMGMLVDGTGRLLYYNAAKNTSSVLLDGLWFANGVALSPDEEFVVVSETAKGQIRRYYLRGPNKETDDIFVDGLIGLPDNLKVIEGGLLVPLVAPRDESHPVIFQSIAPHPLIRKFLVRVLALLELPFTMAQKFLPHYVFEKAAHWIGHFESVQALVPKRTSVIRLDWNGNIVESYHNTDDTLSGISEAHIFENKLYLGSPYNTYIGRVPLPSNIKPFTPTIKPKVAPTVAETPKTKPTEAPTQKTRPTEVPTKKTEPPTQKTKPTEAPTKRTEPPTQKTKPTEAPTKKTEPPTQKTKPTEAPTKRTEPPTQKTKPTEAPTKKTESPTQKTRPTEEQTKKPKETRKEPEVTKQKPPKEEKVAEPKQKIKEEAKPKRAEEKPKIKPIVEEIPSDRKAPREETLKVIKQGEPMEMPNPSYKNKNEL